MKKISSFFPTVLLLVLFMAASPADALNYLREIKNDFTPEKIRMEFFCDHPPMAEMVMFHQNPGFTVDFLECSCSEDTTCRKSYKDPLMADWSLQKENWRRLRVAISLNYDLPEENVKVSILQAPPRLVLDILRCYERERTFTVTKNVLWRILERATAPGYAFINELKIHPGAHGVRLDLALANDDNKSRETTSSMACRTNALAAVNGGFFANSGGPLGLVYKDKQLVSPPVKTRPPRTAFVLMKDNHVIMDRLVPGQSGLSLSSGKVIRNVKWAIGGGPRLISDGRIAITADEEGLGKSGNDITRRAGRTALALNGKGELLVCTVTGYRESHNSGVKLEELAEYLCKLGALEAMCLDGGFSSTMVIQGSIVSMGGADYNKERKVANSIVIYDDSAVYLPYHLDGQISKKDMPADGKSSAEIQVKVIDSQGKPVPEGTGVRLRASLGRLTQLVATKAGYARAKIYSVRLPGEVKIEAECGLAKNEIGTLHLMAGPPHSISARFTSEKKEPYEGEKKNDRPGDEGKEGGAASSNEAVEGYSAEMLVLDEFLNPLPEKVVDVQIYEKGKPRSSQKAATDNRGIAVLHIDVPGDMTKMKVWCEQAGPQWYDLPARKTLR
jgi:exopolysaccharide biosynthesis protein